MRLPINPLRYWKVEMEKSLKEWLKNNKHVKVVTRDRASAYAKAISEELPDAMQVADRFHLHQNLLEAIKKSLNRELPATIKIPKEPESEIEVDNKNDSTIHEKCSGKKKRHQLWIST